MSTSNTTNDNNTTNTGTEIQIITDVITKYYKTGTINTLDIILIIALIIVAVKRSPEIRLLQTATGNVIAYINKDSVNQKKKIEQILVELRALTDADRVVIGMFHNGTSIGSFHFTKISLVYETLKTGITSLRKRYKDVDVTGIEHELIEYSADKFVRNAVSDNNINAGCKRYLNSVGLEAVYSRLIPVANENNYYGVIQIQFASEHNDEITEDRLKEVEKTYSRLLVALDYVRRNKRIPD